MVILQKLVNSGLLGTLATVINSVDDHCNCNIFSQIHAVCLFEWLKVMTKVTQSAILNRQHVNRNWKKTPMISVPGSVGNSSLGFSNKTGHKNHLEMFLKGRFWDHFTRNSLIGMQNDSEDNSQGAHLDKDSSEGRFVKGSFQQRTNNWTHCFHSSEIWAAWWQMLTFHVIKIFKATYSN